MVGVTRKGDQDKCLILFLLQEPVAASRRLADLRIVVLHASRCLDAWVNCRKLLRLSSCFIVNEFAVELFSGN